LTRFDWGDLRLAVLDAGTVWLDGGAMFGVVPKPLWEREREADASNRICLAMNVLLIEDGKRRMLVDTGAGSKWDEKGRRIYRLDARTPRELLAPVGLGPDEIDVVLCTHLHFDHAGGATEVGPDGTLRPAFPNAVYVVQQGELDLARTDNERIRASYVRDNFEPLAAEPGRLRTVAGDVAWTDDVRLELAPGHTPWMQMVLVGGRQGTLAFLADLVPMTSHLRLPWIMGYDLEPLRTLDSKKRVLPRALAEAWVLVFEHDVKTPLGVLEQRDGRIAARAWRPEG